MRTDVVDSEISELRPPITPATATVRSLSQIISVDVVSVRSVPSSVVNFSPSSAFLTMILLPANCVVIERVEGWPDSVHHKIADVDNIIDRPYVAGLEKRLEPLR